MLHHNLSWVITPERQLASTDFKENDTQRIEIAALIADIALSLLRRDIEFRAVPRTAGTTGRSCKQLSDAKVGKYRFARYQRIADASARLRLHSGFSFIKQDIGRFNIAMDHAMLMSVVNCSTGS